MNTHAERTSSAGPDDDALVAASQRGDQAAFGEIVRRYQRAIHRLAWSLTRNANRNGPPAGVCHWNVGVAVAVAIGPITVATGNTAVMLAVSVSLLPSV